MTTATRTQPSTAPQQPAMPLPPQPRYVITDADKKRQKRIEIAWKAYNGELDAPLEKMPGQPDDNVMSNRCQPIINLGVDFLFGKEIEITLGEDMPNRKKAQDFLNTQWGRKETRIPLLQKLGMNGGLAGTPFLRIVPVPDDDQTYRLVCVDPSMVFLQTAPQDCETVLLYCIEYSTTEQIDGNPAQVFYREEIQRLDPDKNAAQGLPDDDDTWLIQHWTRIGQRGTWIPAGEPIVWPHPFPPIFHCQNGPKPNDIWGYPDITPDLIEMNKSLNFVQSNVNRILKIYGHPIFYATGMGNADIDIKPGKVIELPLAESKIVAVSISADVAHALDFAANLRSDIDEQSAVPGVATGRIADIPRGTISGIALQLLFMPLLKKTDKKRCTYGELIIDVCKALLVLAGFCVWSDDITITLNWQSPLPDDNLPDIQGAIAKLTLGVSKTTLLSELGYDAEEEAEHLREEQSQQVLDFARGQGLPPAPLGTKPIPGQPPAVDPMAQPQQPQQESEAKA